MPVNVSIPAELGCIACALLSASMVPDARRIWRGEPSRVDRGLRAAFGSLWVNWERSLPTCITGCITFFGGGALAVAVGALIPDHHPRSHLTVGVVLLILLFLIMLLIMGVGALCTVFTFTTKWYAWPKRLIPPHLRPTEDDAGSGLSNPA